jgi:WXG100 family type VII secretion target
MSFIKVTAEELDSLSAQLIKAAGLIDSENQTAMGQVNGLVGAGWQGAASGQFHELFNNWKTGADQVHKSLTGISQLLSHAATAYRDTEQQIASSMKS